MIITNFTTRYRIIQEALEDDAKMSVVIGTNDLSMARTVLSHLQGLDTIHDLLVEANLHWHFEDVELAIYPEESFGYSGKILDYSNPDEHGVGTVVE